MLAKIIRTYGGQEGRRVKAGTVFSVGEQAQGLPVISLARFRQLQQQRLAEEYLAEGQVAAPGAKPAQPPRTRPAPAVPNKMEPDGKPGATNPAADPSPARRRARNKTQNEAPKEPRPLGRRPDGGQRGEEQPASSSPADHQVGSVTLRQRGTRRGSAGSQSTTPGSSSPGPTSSTPATGPGGAATTPPAPDSAAFD